MAEANVRLESESVAQGKVAITLLLAKGLIEEVGRYWVKFAPTIDAAFASPFAICDCTVA